MRSSARLLKHVPLIKFVGGPHTAKHISHEVKPHPYAPNGILPSSITAAISNYFNSNPIEPKEGQFFSRSELSPRFRYKAPKDLEIDDILSGGADILY
ncbi:uncharacterized protein RJT21DRAFT_123279 [Scheffersomyces amazonensis]|uniref:uncharacterized protein n=1 Tax=Scheffersomyces amazonensis TaxID=1078765 RepID=UPI00315C8EF2